MGIHAKCDWYETRRTAYMDGSDGVSHLHCSSVLRVEVGEARPYRIYGDRQIERTIDIESWETQFSRKGKRAFKYNFKVIECVRDVHIFQKEVLEAFVS